MNIKHIASAAIAAASIVTTPLPSFAEKDPPYIEIVSAVAASLCMYHNGHLASAAEAGEEVWEHLIADGYTPAQITNITSRFKSQIIKLANPERCAELDRQYQRQQSKESNVWS